MLHFMIILLKTCFVWLLPLIHKNFHCQQQKRAREMCCLCARSHLTTWFRITRTNNTDVYLTNIFAITSLEQIERVVSYFRGRLSHQPGFWSKLLLIKLSPGSFSFRRGGNGGTMKPWPRGSDIGAPEWSNIWEVNTRTDESIASSQQALHIGV